ncbi:MAG: hypothetical protein K2Q26_14330, partial [Bdellovibrionales bacterium]|nr:hypothetical protein [Bdellovibrionales bacterium]
KKAVMGDLKAGYLNSFAAFLFADLNEAQRREAFLIHDLDQFKKFIGPVTFNEKLREFDAKNERLIQEFQSLIQKLEEKLLATPGKESWSKGIACLKPLPQPIYWRE